MKREKEFLKRLCAEAERETPDCLSRVMQRCEAEKGAVMSALAPLPPRLRRCVARPHAALAVVAASLVLVALLSAAMGWRLFRGGFAQAPDDRPQASSPPIGSPPAYGDSMQDEAHNPPKEEVSDSTSEGAEEESEEPLCAP